MDILIFDIAKDKSHVRRKMNFKARIKLNYNMDNMLTCLQKVLRDA